MAIICTALHIWGKRSGWIRPIDWTDRNPYGAVPFVPLGLAVFFWYCVLSYVIWGG